VAEPDGGTVISETDAGAMDAGTTPDAGPCVPGQLTQRPLILLGPRISLPAENPKMVDGVSIPAGRVLAMLDPQNQRLVLLGPGWARELTETSFQLRWPACHASSSADPRSAPRKGAFGIGRERAADEVEAGSLSQPRQPCCQIEATVLTPAERARHPSAEARPIHP
jgi:hypothetical protein